MGVTSEQMLRMMVDIEAGRAAPPDETPEAAEVRARLTDEMREIHARGGIVDLPPEIP